MKTSRRSCTREASRPLVGEESGLSRSGIRHSVPRAGAGPGRALLPCSSQLEDWKPCCGLRGFFQASVQSVKRVGAWRRVLWAPLFGKGAYLCLMRCLGYAAAVQTFDWRRSRCSCLGGGLELKAWSKLKKLEEVVRCQSCQVRLVDDGAWTSRDIQLHLQVLE